MLALSFVLRAHLDGDHPDAMSLSRLPLHKVTFRCSAFFGRDEIAGVQKAFQRVRFGNPSGDRFEHPIGDPAFDATTMDADIAFGRVFAPEPNFRPSQVQKAALQIGIDVFLQATVRRIGGRLHRA